MAHRSEPRQAAPTSAAVEDVENLRREVEEMGLQLQATAKTLAKRTADVEYREAELERRRLDVARRHEEQLQDIDGRCRRLAAEYQAKLDLEASRMKEKESLVQDTLTRMGALQRDYDLLQSAMLRVQHREVTDHDEKTKVAARVEDLVKALDGANTRIERLEQENADLVTKAEKATEAMRHYRTELKSAVDRHNTLALHLRRIEAAQLQQERMRVDEAARAAALAKMQASSPQSSPSPGTSGRAWAHDFVMQSAPNAGHAGPVAGQAHPVAGAPSAVSELKSLALNLAAEMAREDEKAAKAKAHARHVRAHRHAERQRAEQWHRGAQDVPTRRAADSRTTAHEHQHQQRVVWHDDPAMTDETNVTVVSSTDDEDFKIRTVDNSAVSARHYHSHEEVTDYSNDHIDSRPTSELGQRQQYERTPQTSQVQVFEVSDESSSSKHSDPSLTPAAPNRHVPRSVVSTAMVTVSEVTRSSSSRIAATTTAPSQSAATGGSRSVAATDGSSNVARTSVAASIGDASTEDELEYIDESFS
jgi:hypothetical protein